MQSPAFFIDEEGQLCGSVSCIDFIEFIDVRHNVGMFLISLIVCYSD